MLKKIEAFARSWVIQFAALFFALFVMTAQKASYDLVVSECHHLRDEVASQQEIIEMYEVTFDDKDSQIAQLHDGLSEYATKYASLRDLIASNAYWTASDIQEVVCMVIAEAGNQSLKGQMAVAQCIYDRYVTGYGGDSLHEVLTARGQFAAPYKGDVSQYPKAFEAVVRVFIYGERVFDREVIYFYNPAIADPAAIVAFEANNEYLGTIGDHVFRSW